jgi:ABC-type transporter Mla maintaining outer membrane lipid asymmetry ATPase subunit MlaF
LQGFKRFPVKTYRAYRLIIGSCNVNLIAQFLNRHPPGCRSQLKKRRIKRRTRRHVLTGESVGRAQHRVAFVVNKYPTSLSGGMRKRTGIARAIICQSECILYDEPNSGLDPIGSDIIDQMILRMQKRFGVTSIIVTHDMRSVFKIANRVAMLYRGKIHFLGTPDELKASPDPIVQNFINGRSDVTG